MGFPSLLDLLPSNTTSKCSSSRSAVTGSRPSLHLGAGGFDGQSVVSFPSSGVRLLGFQPVARALYLCAALRQRIQVGLGLIAGGSQPGMGRAKARCGIGAGSPASTRSPWPSAYLMRS